MRKHESCGEREHAWTAAPRLSIGAAILSGRVLQVSPSRIPFRFAYTNCFA